MFAPGRGVWLRHENAKHSRIHAAFFQRALDIRPGSCECGQLGLLGGEDRERAQALWKSGGCLGILLFEIKDVSVLGKIYGQEIEIAAGVAHLSFARARGQKQAVHDALADAQRMIRRNFIRAHAALSGFDNVGKGHRLFVNVHPRTLIDPSFSPGETLRQLKALGLDPTMWFWKSPNAISPRISPCSTGPWEGYKMAVDDVGIGHSGLWIIAEVRPDCIKLDMSLVWGICRVAIRRFSRLVRR